MYYVTINYIFIYQDQRMILICIYYYLFNYLVKMFEKITTINIRHIAKFYLKLDMTNHLKIYY